jgi:TonB family protein
MKRICTLLILLFATSPIVAGVDESCCRCGDSVAPKPNGIIVAGHNIKMLSRPNPTYPPEAKAAEIEGSVSVSVIFDEEGKVIWAKANDGHPLLQRAAVEAACRSRAKPKSLGKKRVKFYGYRVYKFALN